MNKKLLKITYIYLHYNDLKFINLYICIVNKQHQHCNNVLVFLINKNI